MNRRVAAGVRLAAFLVALGAAGRQLDAQTLALAAGGSTSPAIVAPTAAQYDAASPANVTAQNTAPDFKVKTTCTGSGSAGCTLYILQGAAHQALTLSLQYQVVSATANCVGLTANTALWTDVPTGATIIGTTAKSKSCTADFAFRVKNLDYSVQEAPTTYLQDVTFNLTRP